MDKGPHYWETVNLFASNLPVHLTDLIVVVLPYSDRTQLQSWRLHNKGQASEDSPPPGKASGRGWTRKLDSSSGRGQGREEPHAHNHSRAVRLSNMKYLKRMLKADVRACYMVDPMLKAFRCDFTSSSPTSGSLYLLTVILQRRTLRLWVVPRLAQICVSWVGGKAPGGTPSRGRDDAALG